MNTKVIVFLFLTCYVLKSKSDCPNYMSVSVNGNDGDSDIDIPNIGSWEECGRLCADEPRCTAWDWAPLNASHSWHGVCRLLFTLKSTVYNEGWISGTEHCY